MDIKPIKIDFNILRKMLSQKNRDNSPILKGYTTHVISDEVAPIAIVLIMPLRQSIGRDSRPCKVIFFENNKDRKDALDKLCEFGIKSIIKYIFDLEFNSIVIELNKSNKSNNKQISKTLLKIGFVFEGKLNEFNGNAVMLRYFFRI